MRLAVVQFTCPDDDGIAAISKASVDRVAARHGLDLTYRNYCKEGGRGLHLNGIEAVAEEISIFQELDKDGFDWVLKLDADTLWLGASWLDRLEGSWRMIGGIDSVQGGGALDYRYIRGHGYALRPDTFRNVPQTPVELSELLLLVDSFHGGYPSRPKTPELAWPEDEAITGLVRYLYGDEVILGMPVRDPKVSWVAFWPYDVHGIKCDTRQARDIASRVDFIEFGRNTEATLKLSRHERRKQFTEPAMLGFLEQLR